MASELNALPLETARRLHHCPDTMRPVGGYRTVLFVFRYRGTGDARVLLEGEGCEKITNGRIARDGLKLPHIPFPKEHWPDEGVI